MTVIFDFDDTLFDKSGFVRRLAETMGISEDEFLDTYNEYFKKNEIPYSAYKHLEVLKDIKKGQFNKVSAQQRVDEFLKDVSGFVFPEVEKLLETVGKKEEEIVLLSAGDSEFQRIKIKNSGIAHFFDKIIIDKDKIKGLSSWEKENFIFINDKEEENREVAEKYSGAEILSVGNYTDNDSAYHLQNVIDLWQ
jgi:FMN phosphatase YigB (HAD superfamily)